MITINNIIGEGLRLLDKEDNGIVLKCSKHPEGSIIQQEIEEEIRQEEYHCIPLESLSASNCFTLASTYLMLTREMEENGSSLQLSDNSIITVKELMTIVNSWRKLEKEKKWAEISKKHGL